MKNVLQMDLDKMFITKFSQLCFSLIDGGPSTLRAITRSISTQLYVISLTTAERLLWYFTEGHVFKVIVLDAITGLSLFLQSGETQLQDHSTVFKSAYINRDLAADTTFSYL